MDITRVPTIKEPPEEGLASEGFNIIGGRIPGQTELPANYCKFFQRLDKIVKQKEKDQSQVPWHIKTLYEDLKSYDDGVYEALNGRELPLRFFAAVNSIQTYYAMPDGEKIKILSPEDLVKSIILILDDAVIKEIIWQQRMEENVSQELAVHELQGKVTPQMRIVASDIVSSQIREIKLFFNINKEPIEALLEPQREVLNSYIKNLHLGKDHDTALKHAFEEVSDKDALDLKIKQMREEVFLRPGFGIPDVVQQKSGEIKVEELIRG